MKNNEAQIASDVGKLMRGEFNFDPKKILKHCCLILKKYMMK